MPRNPDMALIERGKNLCKLILSATYKNIYQNNRRSFLGARAECLKLSSARKLSGELSLFWTSTSGDGISSLVLCSCAFCAFSLHRGRNAAKKEMVLILLITASWAAVIINHQVTCALDFLVKKKYFPFFSDEDIQVPM